MPFNSDFPQNSLRARSQATAIPTGRLATIATLATLRLRRTACHSSGVREKKVMASFSMPSPRRKPGSSLERPKRDPGFRRDDGFFPGG